jgi:hypothetical protein
LENLQKDAFYAFNPNAGINILPLGISWIELGKPTLGINPYTKKDSAIDYITHLFLYVDSQEQAVIKPHHFLTMTLLLTEGYSN